MPASKRAIAVWTWQNLGHGEDSAAAGRSTPQGACDYLEPDVRDPGTIVSGAAQTPNLAEPVAIMMLGILNFCPGLGQVQVIVRQLPAAMPSGSYLVISHPTTEVEAEPMIQAVQFWNQQGSAQMTLRTRQAIVL